MTRPLRAIIAAHNELEWRPARTLGGRSSRHWAHSELWGQADRIGELHWLTPDGAAISADIGGERWLIRHNGFWQPQIVAERESPAPLTARFEPSHAGSGLVVTGQGRSYRWLRADWSANWRWTDMDDQSLLHIGVDVEAPMPTGQLRLSPQVIMLDELGLLIALGWYLVTLQLADAAGRDTSATSLPHDLGSPSG